MSDIRTAPIVGEIPRVGEIKVRQFPPDDVSSPKGSNTWNWLYPTGASAGRTMIARRFAADEVGNHFHPRIPNKDPEQFLLLVGKMRFWFKDVFGNEREEIVDADADGPTEIEIPPYILHQFTVMTATAWFLEQQRTAFNVEDNYTPAEFDNFARLIVW
jgi:hypothetical protein